MFAVALGALLGAVMRRTLVAMAATIACLLGVRYVILEFVRPHLFTPLTARSPFHAMVTATGSSVEVSPPGPGDWVVSNQVETPSGRVVGQAGGLGPNGGVEFTMHANGTATLVGVGQCPSRIPVTPGGPHGPSGPATVAALNRCLESFHLSNVVAYQPPSRYWPLQWSEAAIFVALAVALGAVCVWVVRRRLP